MSRAAIGRGRSSTIRSVKIATRVVPSVRPAGQTPAQVRGEFHRLLDDGAVMKPAGDARADPRSLLRRGYRPKYKLELFDTTYHLTDARQNDDIRFYVAYVVQGKAVYPRIFYKDISLVWRSASHFVRSEEENWIGKGDVRPAIIDGEEMLVSAEETSDLPLEIQTALETLLRKVERWRTDEVAIGLVLRRAPDDRVIPYRDFTEPRRRANAAAANRT